MIDSINHINVQYGDALDRHDYDTWINFFMTDGLYMVQSRENHDRNLPLALIRLESHAMMRDRIYGCMDTIFHQPYYTRHLISNAVIVSQDDLICTRTNYAVFRTKPTSTSEVFNVGCYHDQWIQTKLGPKLKQRLCIYDTEMVLNALIYPV